MPIIDIQKRARELGRIRLGQKGDKGQPQKLARFRLTSPARHLIEKVAELYGGEVREWTPAGGSQQWEVITEATRLPIMVPPQPVSQWYEAWTAGGCTHRCDGETDYITGEACDPESALHKAAKPTTRLNVVLRDVLGVGVWRLESHGWNAAVELPQAAEFLAQVGGYVNGWVSLEERVSKSIEDGKPQTRKFMVPIIEIDVTPAELMAGGGRVAPPELGESPRKQLEAPQEAVSDPYARFFDLLDRATNLDLLRAIWAEMVRENLLGSHAPETQRALEFIAAYKSKGEDLTAAASGDDPPPVAPAVEDPPAPVPDEDGVVDGEVVGDDTDPDADAVWSRIVETAGRLEWTTSTLTADFKNRMGMIPDEATAAELQAYLELIVAEVPS